VRECQSYFKVSQASSLRRERKQECLRHFVKAGQATGAPRGKIRVRVHSRLNCFCIISSGGGIQGGNRNCPGFHCKQGIVSRNGEINNATTESGVPWFSFIFFKSFMVNLFSLCGLCALYVKICFLLHSRLNPVLLRVSAPPREPCLCLHFSV